jgi:1-acyl-sn-glycerol-3-phosphate acyltransferase
VASLQPNPEQLASLTQNERIAYRIGDIWHRWFWWVSMAWNGTFMMFVTWVTVRRRLHIAGLEATRKLDPNKGVVFVANHRTFFDFFTISCVAFHWFHNRRRLMFPVRSEFFYTKPLGWVVTAFMSAFCMFPPIKRQRRGGWNLFAVARCVQGLKENQVMVGIHPEGRRFPDSDPFAVHPGKSGAARVALDAGDDVQVVPVFLTGISNDLWAETKRNWLHKDAYPVFLSFGEPIDLSDLSDTSSLKGARQATDRLMGGIEAQAARCRVMAAEFAADPNAAAKPSTAER